MLGEVILKAVIILVFGVPLAAGCLTLYVGAVWMKMQEEMKNNEQDA